MTFAFKSNSINFHVADGRYMEQKMRLVFSVLLVYCLLNTYCKFHMQTSNFLKNLFSYTRKITLKSNEWNYESDYSDTNDSNKGMGKQKARRGTLLILHFIILV